MNMENQGTTR